MDPTRRLFLTRSLPLAAMAAITATFGRPRAAGAEADVAGVAGLRDLAAGEHAVAVIYEAAGTMPVITGARNAAFVQEFIGVTRSQHLERRDAINALLGRSGAAVQTDPDAAVLAGFEGAKANIRDLPGALGALRTVEDALAHAYVGLSKTLTAAEMRRVVAAGSGVQASYVTTLGAMATLAAENDGLVAVPPDVTKLSVQVTATALPAAGL